MSKARDLAGVLGGNAVLNIGDVASLQTTLDGKAPAGSYAPAVHNHNDLYPTDTEVASAINSAVAGKLSIDTNTTESALNYAVGYQIFGLIITGSVYATHNGTVSVYKHNGSPSFQGYTSGSGQPSGSNYTLLPGTWRVRQPSINEFGGQSCFAVQRVA